MRNGERDVSEMTKKPQRRMPRKTVTASAWSEKRKRIVRAWVDKHLNTLHISDYEVRREFHETPRSDDDDCSADTIANHPYRTGNKINFYPRWLKWNERQQELRVIHELLHIVIDPLYGLLHKAIVKEHFVTWREAKETNELITDHLTMIIADLALSRLG